MGEVGAIEHLRGPVFWAFSAAQAQGWAKPKSYWVVSGKGLGVYKSTLKFWPPGSLGALRGTFQFYYIEMTPNSKLGPAQPRGHPGPKFFGIQLP